MKNIFAIYVLVFTVFAINAQISFDNTCSVDLQIVFCSNEQAKTAFQENAKEDLNYLNLILDDKGLKYRGQNYFDIEKVNDVFVEPKTISKTYNVVIGLERKAPIEYFKRFICTIEQLGVLNINSVYVYFYSVD